MAVAVVPAAYAAGGTAFAYKGKLASNGSLVVTGNLRCSQPQTVSLEVVAAQTVQQEGDTVPRGKVTKSGLSCTAKITDWTLTVPATDVKDPFRHGTVAVVMSATNGSELSNKGEFLTV
ncbi:hypothetical protein [Kutzneria sp. 744]|uniref:hypothetical protein n=1 Tax=Kutzneria sp. (strain 744) TaxID=345341 RepID=UPI0005B80D43|nr:hypothetical protein [Kutzneria sp. 744]